MHGQWVSYYSLVWKHHIAITSRHDGIHQIIRHVSGNSTGRQVVVSSHVMETSEFYRITYLKERNPRWNSTLFVMIYTHLHTWLSPKHVAIIPDSTGWNCCGKYKFSHFNPILPVLSAKEFRSSYIFLCEKLRNILATALTVNYRLGQYTFQLSQRKLILVAVIVAAASNHSSVWYLRLENQSFEVSCVPPSK